MPVCRASTRQLVCGCYTNQTEARLEGCRIWGNVRDAVVGFVLPKRSLICLLQGQDVGIHILWVVSGWRGTARAAEVWGYHLFEDGEGVLFFELTGCNGDLEDNCFCHTWGSSNEAYANRGIQERKCPWLSKLGEKKTGALQDTSSPGRPRRPNYPLRLTNLTGRYLHPGPKLCAIRQPNVQTLQSFLPFKAALSLCHKRKSRLRTH